MRIRRAVGTQGDPLAFAYSMVFPLILIINYRKIFKYFWILLLILSLGIILSLTRAIIFSIIITLIIEEIFKRRFLIFLLLTSLIGLIVVALLGNKATIFLSADDSSTHGHVGSLVSLLDRDIISIIVGNLLSGGNNFYRYESGFLNILVNYGIVTTFVYYGFIFKMINYNYRINTPLNRTIAITGGIGMFTSIIFSESFFSFTGYGLFWLLSGIAVSHHYQKRLS